MWAFIQNRQIGRIVAHEYRDEQVVASNSLRTDLEMVPPGEEYLGLRGLRKC